MRHERQVELLQRVADGGPRLTGLFGEHSAVQPASAYTDEERFAREVRIMFREGPTFLGLSCECAEEGSYLTATLGKVPVVVVRQPDASLRGFVNACRHRGAPLFEPGRGTIKGRIACGYHAWTYETDGRLAARPMSDGAFDDVSLNCDLHPVPVAEKHGMIFVRAGGGAPVDADAFLDRAGDDLGAFGLENYTLIGSRTATWKMNWKLILDTFTESYHIRWLHKDSLAPTFLSDCTIFEAFGKNLLSVGLRKSVFEEFDKPVEEWSLLPYGTIQYFLVPNGLVVYQLDHVESWRIEPIDVRTTRVVTSLHSPQPPATEKAHRYFTKNLDLLLQVTGTEDFPLMEKIQANLDSGALPEVVYGRVEPPLVYFHQSVNRILAEAADAAEVVDRGHGL